MARTDDHDVDVLPLPATDFHVLLALMDGASYGYALLKAVREQSGGAVSPEIGSLYRVLARLLGLGLVDEAGEPPHHPDAHPGRPRKYYRLTPAGRRVAAAEAARMRGVLELARQHRLLPGSGRQ